MKSLLLKPEMNNTRQKLVLHVCCAPDQAYVLKLLSATHHIHCFFSNPNIHPQDEYRKRLEEAQRVAEHFGVPLDAAQYEPHLWEDAVKGLEGTGEGGERCRQCFLVRLRQTARFCAQLGWPSFTSTMSISPHKSIALLNETGRQAAEESGVEYASFDFKKKDGFKKSVELSRELGLYRQDYCGCRLSWEERHSERAARSSVGRPGVGPG